MSKRKRKGISGIYGYFDSHGNCLYVGQSENVYTRDSQHIKALREGRHINRYLQNFYNKCGEKALKFRVLAKCWICQLDAKEDFWIYRLNARFNIRWSDNTSIKRNGNQIIQRDPSKKTLRYRKIFQVSFLSVIAIIGILMCV